MSRLARGVVWVGCGAAILAWWLVVWASIVATVAAIVMAVFSLA